MTSQTPSKRSTHKWDDEANINFLLNIIDAMGGTVGAKVLAAAAEKAGRQGYTYTAKAATHQM